MIATETNRFKKLKRLYPNSQVKITKAWCMGLGWTPFHFIWKNQIKNSQLSFPTILRKMKRLGYTKVELEIKNTRRTVTTDYKITELLN